MLFTAVLYVAILSFLFCLVSSPQKIEVTIKVYEYQVKAEQEMMKYDENTTNFTSEELEDPWSQSSPEMLECREVEPIKESQVSEFVIKSEKLAKVPETISKYEEWSVRKLRDFCKNQKINNYSSVLKKEGKKGLVKLIKSHEASIA